MGAAWRAIAWGGTSNYSESKKSWSVTYAAKSFDPPRNDYGSQANQYDVVTSFGGPKKLIGNEERDQGAEGIETKQYWQEQIDKGRVEITDDRFYALGTWAAFALPVGKLLGPAKSVQLYAEGSGVAVSETRAILKEAVEAIPVLDATGKVHGTLPRIQNLFKYSREDLEILLQELKMSVKRRIEVTAKLGRDRGHGQRQGAEQDLIQAIVRFLENTNNTKVK